MDELDLFRNFRRGVATPSADAQRRASARLESALDEVVGREKAARLRLGRRRWPLVAIAVAIVAGMALLATPALGIGDRLLSLIQSKRSPAKDVRPAWSPDGRRIAFVSRRDGNSEIYVMNADGSGKRNLTRDRARDVFPTWSPDGRRIAFLRARLYSNNPGGLGVHRFYGYHLYVVNADGRGLRRLTLNFTGRYQLVWSPDGRTIYFGRDLVNADGSGARRLPYIPLTAVWSPDGRQIAFVNNPRRDRLPGQLGPCCIANSDVYVMNADGSGLRRLTHNAAYDGEPAWSPDGRKIAFQSKRRVGGNGEIYVMNADGSGKRNLTRNPAQDGSPSWSPDGRRIAFVSDRDGRLEAYVMNADGSGQRSLTLQER